MRKNLVWYIVGFVMWVCVGFMLGQSLGQEPLPSPAVEVMWLQPGGPTVLTDEIYGLPLRAPHAAELIAEGDHAWLILYQNPKSSVWVGPRRFALEEPKLVKIQHPGRLPWYAPRPFPSIQGPPMDEGLRLLVLHQRIEVGSWVRLAASMRVPLIRWEE